QAQLLLPLGQDVQLAAQRQRRAEQEAVEHLPQPAVLLVLRLGRGVGGADAPDHAAGGEGERPQDVEVGGGGGATPGRPRRARGAGGAARGRGRAFSGRGGGRPRSSTK